VTKPLAIARHLDDADYLAQIEAVDRFTANMIAYPGRTFGQLYHRLLKGNALVDGTFEVGARTLSVAAITAPVLVFAGAADGIAPVASVKASVPLLTGARDVRFEIVPGGHLGMLTGRKARTSTWLVLDEWVDQWSGPAAPAAPRARRTSTKKAATKKAPTKRATPKKAPTKRATPKKTPVKKATPADAAEIGTNPTRRYGSAGSRALGDR
jgi:polyhydroxyalkanoate synthase